MVRLNLASLFILSCTLIKTAYAAHLAQTTDDFSYLDFLPPNDFYFQKSFDGTYNFNTMLDDGTRDLSQLENIMDTFDGWPVNAPIHIPLASKEGVSINKNTLDGASIQVYQVELKSASPQHADCFTTELDRIEICHPEQIKQLTYVPQKDITYNANSRRSYADAYTVFVDASDHIVIQPIYPFKTGTSYLISINNRLLDTQGRAIKASDTLKHLVSQPSTPVYDALKILEARFGQNADQVIYTSVFTTLAPQTTYNVVMQHMIEDTQNPPSNPKQSYHVALNHLQKESYKDMNHLFELCGSHCDHYISPKLIRMQDAMMQPNRGGFFGSNFLSSQLSHTTIYSAQLHLPLYASHQFKEEGSCISQYHEDAFDNSIFTCHDQLKNRYWTGASTNMAALLRLYQAQPSTEDKTALIDALTHQTQNQVDFILLASMHTPETFNTLQQQLITWNVNHPEASLTYKDKVIDPAHYVTALNPLPKIIQRGNIDVLITTPEGEAPTQGWPIVLLTHGITSSKEDNLLLAEQYSKQGLATISIDLPFHGMRSIYLTRNEQHDYAPYRKADFSASEREEFYGLETFLYTHSLPTIRDNIRQAVLDFLALKLAIMHLPVSKTSPHTVLLDDLKIDIQKVGIQGFSLGAIIAESIAAYASDYAEENNPYLFQAAALVSPAMDMTEIIFHSSSYQNTILKNIKLAWIYQQKKHQLPTYNSVWQQDKEEFVFFFTQIARMVASAADPISSIYQLRDNLDKQPLMLIQINNDQVVPNKMLDINSQHYSTTTGTEPMISILNAHQPQARLQQYKCKTSQKLDLPFESVIARISSKNTMPVTHSSLVNFKGYTKDIIFKKKSVFGRPIKIFQNIELNYQKTHSIALQGLVTQFFKGIFDQKADQHKYAIEVNNSIQINTIQ